MLKQRHHCCKIIVTTATTANQNDFLSKTGSTSNSTCSIGPKAKRLSLMVDCGPGVSGSQDGRRGWGGLLHIWGVKIEKSVVYYQPGKSMVYYQPG